MIEASDPLVDLVTTMGFQAFLPSEWAPDRLTNLLENLLRTRILERHDDQLILAEAYALSLGVLPRARILARGQGRKERESLLEYLRKRLHSASY